MNAIPAPSTRLAPAALIQQALVRGDPDDPGRLSDLAWSMQDLVVALDAAGRPDDALRRVGRAIAALEGLARDHPAHTGYRERLGDCLQTQAILRRRAGDPAASRSLERSLAIYEALAGDHPASTGFREALGWGYLDLAAVRAAAGRTDEALVLIRKAERIAERLPAVRPLPQRRCCGLAGRRSSGRSSSGPAMSACAVT